MRTRCTGHPSTPSCLDVPALRALEMQCRRVRPTLRKQPGRVYVMGREVWAEQALLGSILLDPAGEQHVLDLVQCDDMRRPWHGQVVAAMQRLRGRGVLPAPIEVYEELTKDPDLPRTASSDAVPLVNLMEAGHAPHAPAYAAMVIDGGIRQRLALAGSRMTQAAEDAEGEPLEAALRQTEAARRDLDAATLQPHRSQYRQLRSSPRMCPHLRLKQNRKMLLGRDSAPECESDCLTGYGFSAFE